MKKLIFTFMLSVAAISMVSCSGNKAVTTEDTDSTTIETTTDSFTGDSNVVVDDSNAVTNETCTCTTECSAE